jgi:hypothetical protein
MADQREVQVKNERPRNLTAKDKEIRVRRIAIFCLFSSDVVFLFFSSDYRFRHVPSSDL